VLDLIRAVHWSPPSTGDELVKLSVLLPTHRHNLLACSRIAQACSWAGPDIEVIVRDNSGNARKREILTNFQRDNCLIITAEPCESGENYADLLRRATGEFVFCLGDDDLFFDHAIGDLPGVIGQIGADRSFVGITGSYAVEASNGTSLASYQNIESGEASARVAGYLSYPGPNVLFYSVMRRDLVNRVYDFMNAMPAYSSFHDQIVCMLYLLNGKFFRLQRLMYLYNVGPWEGFESAQKRDVDFYNDAGLDPAINKLHWFLCAFEGAALALNSDLFPDHSLAQRQAVTNSWFGTMFHRFKGHERLTFGSPFADDAEKLCAKLRAMEGTKSFDSMLTDICAVFSLFSKSHAQNYFDFWDAVLNKRKPVSRDADASRASA
jgi:Glycosyl transferase family 2